VGVGVTADGVATATEREVLAYVRHRRKAHSRHRLSDRLINVYMWIILSFYAVTAVGGFIDADLTYTPGNYLDTIAWVPLVLLVMVWGVLHFATWQGPVLFTPSELQWVMSAPLSQRELVLMRLRRAFLLAGLAGIVGGGVAAGATAVMIDEWRFSVFAVATAGFGALALMATALSWNLERSVRWSTLFNRLAPVVLVAAALLALGAANRYDTALWWSGPWGWATGPMVAEAGWPTAGWGIQAGMLGLAMLGAIIVAVVTAGRFSDEELWRRAEARSSASAALFFGDLRTVKNIARRGRARGRVRGRAFQLPHPPSPWLTIASRDVLALRRNPGRVATAAFLMAGAFTAAVAAVERPILAIVVFVGLYASGSRLLEPIRLEVDQPDAHLLLPWTWGNVLVLHCLVPTIVLTIFGWIGVAVVGIGGFIQSSAIWPLVVVAPFAAAAIVAPAAISAARRPFPVESLISGGEGGPFVLIGWLFGGPVLAVIVVDIAFGSIRDSLDQGLNGSTVNAVFFLIAATLALIAWLRTRKPPV